MSTTEALRTLVDSLNLEIQRFKVENAKLEAQAVVITRLLIIINTHHYNIVWLHKYLLAM